MRALTLLSLLATFSAATCTVSEALRTSAARHSRFWGALSTPHTDDSGYTALMKKHLSMLTAGNACKMDATEPSQNSFSYTACDSVYNFAKSNNMTFRGHTLVWHSQVPSWMKNSATSARRSIMINHVKNVATHYKGKLYGWDVVNEAVLGTGGLRSSTWYPTISNFIDLAFTTARAADSSAKLFYNDYSADTVNTKSTYILTMMKSMKSRSIPIDGIGFQMHVSVNGAPTLTALKTNFQRFADAGFEVHITEADVGVTSSAQFSSQATVYSNIVTACLAVSKCTAILPAGISDKYTWRKSELPLLWDSSFNPKAAACSVSTALRGTKSAAPQCILTLPSSANDFGTCASGAMSSASCKFSCKAGYTAVAGTCSNGTWSPAPSCSANCTPTTSCSAEEQTCGSLWNGCSFVSCGSCSLGQFCDNSSSCVSPKSNTESLDNWEQVFPNTSATKESWAINNGALEQIDFTNPSTARCLAYKGRQEGWFGGDTVKMSVYMKGSSGKMGAGLRMGQVTGEWDRVGWTLELLNGGKNASAAFCRVYKGSSDECTNWSNPIAADESGGYNLTMEYVFGSNAINTFSWVNGQAVWWFPRSVKASEYLIKGSMFLWTVDTTATKSFSNIVVHSKSSVHITINHCMDPAAWNAFVVKLMGVNASSRAARSDANCSRKRDMVGGSATEFITEISDESLSMSSSSIIESLQTAILADGAAATAGIDVAFADAVAVEVVAAASAFTTAAALSAGAIAGIAVGASVAGIAAVSGTAVGVAVAVKRRRAASVEKPQETAMETKSSKRGVDIMNHPEQNHASITARAPPVAV